MSGKPELLLKLLSIPIFLLLTFEPLSFNTFAAHKNPCLTCHKNYKKPTKNIHPALDIGCEACHVTVQGKEHPKHEDSVKLRYDVPGLCYNCHKESKFKGSDVHSPVAGGMCTSCHDAHRSDFKKLLINEPPELCYGCHKKAKFTQKYSHLVALNGCGRRCHNPHASDKPYLLSLGVNDVCTGCHKAQETGRHIVSLPKGHIHPVKGFPDPEKPTKELSCASCHNPHSSNFERLFASRKKWKRCHEFY